MKATLRIHLYFLLCLSSPLLLGCNDTPANSVADSDTADIQTSTTIEFLEPIPENKYTVECHTLCDDEHGILLNMDTLKKYDTYNPYHLTQTITGDSVIIDFDFITDCCATFTGEVANDNDTLYLGYYFDRDSMHLCDCWCDYRMNYHISKTNLNWSAIKIVHGKPRKS